MTHRAAALVLALSALLACDDAGGLQPLDLTLLFTPDANMGLCLATCTAPAACPLDCASNVGLFVGDADSDEVRAEACQVLTGDPARTLDQLPEIIADMNDLVPVAVGDRVVVELVIYAPSSTVTGCPRARMTADIGIPVTDQGIPASYFGRSAVFSVRDGHNEVSLPVGCFDFGASCASRPDVATITSQIYDLNAPPLVVDEATAQQLDVIFGDLRPVEEGRVEFYDPRRLTLTDAASAIWTREEQDPFFDNNVCLGTYALDSVAPIGYPVLSCDGEIDPLAEQLTVSTRGYAIDKSTVDAMIAALGLPGFPGTGLVVGRVVDNAGNPVAGATVAPDEGVAPVLYLEDSGGGFTVAGTTTSANGWFVVRDVPALPSPFLSGSTAPCCAPFVAQTATKLGCSRGPIGLVNDVLFATLIELDTGSCPP